MINTVGIVGGGIMGSGIAEVVARSGCHVVLREINVDAIDVAQRRFAASLDKAVRNGKLSTDERDATLKRVSFTDTLDDLAECDHHCRVTHGRKRHASKMRWLRRETK